MKKKIMFSLFLFILVFSSISVFAVESSNYGLKTSAIWSESQNYIKVDVTNLEANSQAAYSIGATCTSGFSQIGTAWTISGLSLGETKSAYLTILGGNSNGICEVTITDIGNPNNKFSLSVPVSVLADSKICNEGNQRPIGQVIEECRNNAWVQVKTCPSDTSPSYEGNPNKLNCVKESEGLSSEVIFYGGILILIILLIVGDILFKKFKISVKKRK